MASRQSHSGSGQSGHGSSKTTTNHEEIRQWVEAHGGKPACVRGTGGKDDVGLLRIDFPGYSGEETLAEIPWEEFFEKFEDNELAFVYQDGAKGERSRFSKLVSREHSKHKGESGRK